MPSILNRLLAPWKNGNGAHPPLEAKTVPGSGVTVRPVTWVGSPGWQNVYELGGGNPNAEKIDRATAFITSAYCYVAMLWRMKRVAEAPLMVAQETEAGTEWQPDHPLAELFDTPRPDLRMSEIIQRTVSYQDLTSSALWLLSLDLTGTRRQITPFSGAEVKDEPADGLIYGRYSVLINGTWKPVDREQVIHFRDVDPFTWRKGTSRVDAALNQLNLSHNVERITKNFLLKAMFPGGIISPDKDWHPTPQEWEDWKAAIEAWNAGPSNAGTPLYAQGGTIFTKVASGMADLLPSAVLDRVEATVGSVFGIPPVVLGWLTGLQNSPWSQMEEARRQAYEDTIEPMWTEMADVIGRVLLTPEERKAGFLVRFDTSRVRALQDDQELHSRISLNNADIWTVGERRLFTGMTLLDDDRDDIIVGLQSSTPAPNLGQGNSASSSAAAAGGKSADTKADTKDLLWLIFDLETKAREPKWARVIGAHLDELKGKILAGLEQHVHNAGDGKGIEGLPALAELKQLPLEQKATRLPDWLKRLLEEDEPRLAAKAYPLLIQTGGAGVHRLAARLKVSFSVLEPGLLTYAKREADFLAKVMGETTGNAVAQAIQDGLEAGETIAALSKRLQDLPEFDRTRAKLVARTETTRAWNGAQRSSMSLYSRTSGKTVLKSWLSARDDRVRDEHAALDDETDGKGIPVDEAFSNGLTEPGEPNCRCSLTYEIDDSEVDAPSPETD